MHRRLFIAASVITAIFFIYIVRLGALQLLGVGGVPVKAPAQQADWRRTSVIQRQHSLVIDTGRGDFVDRNGQALTGETYSSLAFFPIDPKALASEQHRLQMKRLAALLGVTAAGLEQYWHQLERPAYWSRQGEQTPIRLTEEQRRKLSELRLDGVKVLPYHNRYLDGFNAAQTIGYISQHPEWMQAEHGKEVEAGRRKLTDLTGGSGLERSLDDLLRGIGRTSAMYFTDGRNMPLQGLGMRLVRPDNGYYPLSVVTTLDLDLQRKLEAYADEAKLKQGAIVVLDARNADIVAIVSRPRMNPRRLESDESAVNHALKAVPPGSVFKLVTEAAALEAGVTSEKETFSCDGEYGKYGLSCWKKGGHGTLTLREGLAQSCNIVFATLGERLTAEQLERTALALGVGRQVGWSTEKPYKLLRRKLRLLPEEEAGSVFYTPEEAGKAGHDQGNAAQPFPEADGGARAQSAIGQRDVRMTPLQAANLIVTLLHGGKVTEPRIVSEIRYANGVRMAKLKSRKAPYSDVYGQISPATARKLMRGMEAVVDHGTGSSIREGRWTVAGKSGTAETALGSVRFNHQWFAGYGPVRKPRYAVAVLSEYRPPDSRNQATAIFRGVMDLLAEAEAEDRNESGTRTPGSQ